MKHTHFKRLVALILAFTMVMGLGVTGASAAGDEKQSLSYEKLDGVSGQLTNADTLDLSGSSNIADDEIVRVTIVLEGESAVSALGGAAVYSDTAALRQYRSDLKARQQALSATISRDVLNGQSLEVVWNLTLATNAISANVQYGQIKAIEKVSGVKAVIVEPQYYPLNSVETNNIISQQMTGASTVHSAGYTGAGKRIAVIDTGIDTDHQSFAEDAFLYSFDLHGGDRSVLLNKEDVANILTSLNAYSYAEDSLSADDLYISSKIPFGYNYADHSLDVTHDNDSQGSHGSHVSGIAAANAYISTGRLYDFDGDHDFDQDDVQALMNYVVLGTSITNIGNADINGDGAITDYDAHLFLDELAKNPYRSADETVAMSGVAPDAQIITMKVFGASTTSSESDYIAAIEDAVMLGCDTINLSLGAAYAGFSHSYTYAYYDKVFKNLEEETGVVVCISAGNSGNWADDDSAYQLMYADEGGTGTTGNPATYKNALAVASANNVGSISDLQTVFTGGASNAEIAMDFSAATVANGNPATWYSLDPTYTGTKFEAVFLGDPSALFAGQTQTDSRIYAGSADDFAGYDFTGKVVFVARGTYSFADKYDTAAAAGAAAVVIYNNEAGTIYADLTGSTATVPCATISLAEARSIFELFTKNTSGLYTGTLSVSRDLSIDYGEDTAVSMSYFSSWGSTGALTIKPEITAPGGGIYSVNGMDPSGSAYENMSGTSMSAPHTSGLATLASQYIEDKGLSTAFGHTTRQLVQSLLMSTAEPIIEESTGLEYSARNQGSGLANIQNVVSAQSYIMVDGQNDGKVKAELGELRTGTASFAFTIYNFGSSAQTYDLSASILTPGTTVIDGYALSTDEMVELDADVTFSTGSTVTVAAGQSKKVNVTISVSEATATALAELGHTNGFYVEGYVYAKPQATAEGVQDVTHSIPLLGWYGNWTDPSMFDTGSYIDFYYGNDVRPSHIFDHLYSGNSTYKNFLAMLSSDSLYPYLFTGSPYGDESYNEERNAINLSADRDTEIYGIYPTMIRNSADFDLVVTDQDGKVWYQDDYEGSALIGNFYYNTYWADLTTESGVLFDSWDFGENIPEGTRLTVTLRAIPEYYVSDEDTYFDSLKYVEDYDAVVFDGYELPDSAWTDGTIGDGAFLSWSFTVDNTAPTLSGNTPLTLEGNTLTFRAQDNNYVAAVILMTSDGQRALDYYYPDMPTAWKGEAITGSFDLSKYTVSGERLVLAVCDYAGNESYYAVNLNGIGKSFGDLVGFQYGSDSYGFSATSEWVAFSSSVDKNEYSLFSDEHTIIAAEYINGLVFAQDKSGKLYGINYNDMVTGALSNLETTYITTLDRVYVDFAYNYSNGTLYALHTSESDRGINSTVYAIDINGSYNEDWVTSRDDLYALGMAIDDAGTIYLMGPTQDFDTKEISDTAHLWSFQYTQIGSGWGATWAWNGTDVGDTGIRMDYRQSMAWDHNSETLYWAQFVSNKEDSVLYTVDPVTGSCTKSGTLSTETCAMFAPLTAESAAKDSHKNVPTFDFEAAGQPVLSVHSLSMGVNTTEQVNCTFEPWYSAYTDVVWTSSNDNVATVSQSGLVTAVGAGTATITATNKADPSKSDHCVVSVMALSLVINGTVSQTSGGTATASDSYLYNYTLTDGISAMTIGNAISDPEFGGEMGLKIGAALEANGSIWACEWNNTGIIYKMSVDGVIEDMLSPVDAYKSYGISYSATTGKFSTIMNCYFFADLTMTYDDASHMLESYDEETNEFTWHRIDMSAYLKASDSGFDTGEAGQGSDTAINFCAITDIDEPYVNRSYTDFLGNDVSGTVTYMSTTTHVLLDNVGRLWYIDEIPNLTLCEEWGEVYYSDEYGSYIAPDSTGNYSNGLFFLDGDNDTVTAFYIREMVETPLTEQFRAGTMIRYTYHFSDMYYLGKSEAGAPMFLMSLYDYWNNGRTNNFYLYVGGVGTGDYEYDPNVGNYVEVKTPAALYPLGTTGDGNIIATITSARYIGGLPTSGTTDEPQLTTLSTPGFFGE